MGNSFIDLISKNLVIFNNPYTNNIVLPQQYANPFFLIYRDSITWSLLVVSLTPHQLLPKSLKIVIRDQISNNISL